MSSIDAAALERNICFIDTPALSNPTRTLTGLSKQMILDYITCQWRKTTALSQADDLLTLGLLTGEGGTQVDVLFYLFSHGESAVTVIGSRRFSVRSDRMLTVLPPDGTSTSDWPFIRQLSELTNVVPLIAKSDLLSPDRITALRKQVLVGFRSADAQPFLFGRDPDEVIQDLEVAEEVARTDSASGRANRTADGGSSGHMADDSFDAANSRGSGDEPLYPFLVSSALTSDEETMDASLLMSSTYLQPLAGSELADLVKAVFHPDGISWLRYAAVKKYLARRRRGPGTGGGARARPATSPGPLVPEREPARRPGGWCTQPSTDQSLGGNEESDASAGGARSRSLLDCRHGHGRGHGRGNGYERGHGYRLAHGCAVGCPRRLGRGRAEKGWWEHAPDRPADPLGLLRLRNTVGRVGHGVVAVVGAVSLVSVAGLAVATSIRLWTGQAVSWSQALWLPFPLTLSFPFQFPFPFP